MGKTNFDRYLEEQLQDPAFAARFEHAGEAWDVALQIAALRQQAGPSRQEPTRGILFLSPLPRTAACSAPDVETGRRGRTPFRRGDRTLT